MYNIWVHRLPGKPSGNPTDSNCPPIDTDRIVDAWSKPARPLRDCEENNKRPIYFILNELYLHGRLRQGWGTRDLDLRQPEKEWVEKYLIAEWVYWRKKHELTGGNGSNLAMGRRRILACMLRMQPGDVVFLPKMDVIGQRESEAHFSVMTVAGAYQFEDRSQKPHTWEQDFGHYIEVHTIKTYEYSDKTLGSYLFGAPFLHAIDEVRPNYSCYDIIKNFIQYEYRRPWCSGLVEMRRY